MHTFISFAIREFIFSFDLKGGQPPTKNYVWRFWQAGKSEVFRGRFKPVFMRLLEPVGSQFFLAPKDPQLLHASKQPWRCGGALLQYRTDLLDFQQLKIGSPSSEASVHQTLVISRCLQFFEIKYFAVKLDRLRVNDTGNIEEGRFVLWDLNTKLGMSFW